MKKKRTEYGPSDGQQLMRGLVEAAREVQREETKKKSTGDHTVDYLIRTGQSLTVQNYFETNWSAVDGIEKIEDLDAENLADVQRLVERGLLVDTRNPHNN
jgi:hypothetical protein